MLNTRNIIAYHIVDHCNLNCSACNHFSPLAKPRFANIDKFEKNISKLSKILKIAELNLLGGEPLLHPELIEFVKIARKILKNEFICIWTNGILLNSMDSTFFTEIKKRNICIRITNYGAIKHKSSYYNIKFIDKRLMNTKYLSTEKSCNWKCPFYRNHTYSPLQLNENGDLFLCCIPANVHHYNDYYGTNIIVEKDKDYVNIYEDFVYTEFLKKKIEKIPFCHYCRKSTICNWSKFDSINNKWINNT